MENLIIYFMFSYLWNHIDSFKHALKSRDNKLMAKYGNRSGRMGTHPLLGDLTVP